MQLYWLLILLPLTVGLGWYLATLSISRAPRTGGSLPKEYFRGLNFLLNEERDKALEVLVTALEKDKDTVEVQLALGSLFRKRGEIQRATRVHQNLVARTQLDGSQRVQSLYELAQDYYKAGLFDRAEHLLLEIEGADELEESPQKLLLQIYEQEKEWENAIKVAKNLEIFDKKKLRGIIAHYNCEIAEDAITEGRYSIASEYIQNAKLIDRNSTRAIIQAGRVKAIQQDHRGAIEEWLRGANLHSELPGEIYKLIHNSYKMLGDLGQYRNFLLEMLEVRDDIRLVLALTEYLCNHEGEEQAEIFLLERIRRSPSVSGLHRLIQIRLSKHGAPSNNDLRLLEQLIGGIVDDNSGYECGQCGFHGKVMHWQCPGCRSWNTTLARVHERAIAYGVEAA